MVRVRRSRFLQHLSEFGHNLGSVGLMLAELLLNRILEGCRAALLLVVQCLDSAQQRSLRVALLIFLVQGHELLH